MDTFLTQIHPEELPEFSEFDAYQEMLQEERRNKLVRDADLVVLINDRDHDDLEVAIEIYGYHYTEEKTTREYQGGIYIEDIELCGTRTDTGEDFKITEDMLGDYDRNKLYDIIIDREDNR